MICETQQPFRAVLIRDGQSVKVIALLSEEHCKQLAPANSALNGLVGEMSAQLPRMAVDLREVSKEEFEALSEKAT